MLALEHHLTVLLAVLSGCGGCGSGAAPSTARASAVSSPSVPVPGVATPASVPVDADSVDVTSYGAQGDGVADDTPAFILAASTGKNLRVPRPLAHYKLTSTVRLQASLLGDGLPEIRMYGATGKEAQAMFEVRGYAGSGLVIRGLHLDGQWDGAGTAGEWSHLVMIKGSQNVTVEENVLERPYGDCVLVGGEGVPAPSENIVIRRNQMSGPRRCAVALISVRRASIDHNVIRKQSGFVSAIDLEPNPNRVDSVHDVEIAANDFDVAGLAIQLYTLPANLPSGGVTVRDNVAKAARFFQKKEKTGSWSRITLSGNTYLGKASGDSAFDIAEAADVVVTGNSVTPAAATASGGDRFQSVAALRLVNNVWAAGSSYALMVNACPDAELAGNSYAEIRVDVHP